MITDKLKIALEQRITAASTPGEAVIDVMKILQSHYGWLTDEAVAEAAQLLGMSALKIEELATFYEMIYRRPVGKRIIHVCDSISCWTMGGETLLQQIADYLGIKTGQTTGDNIFTLLPCCCLGNCGEAPTIMIGNDIYGRLTLEKAVEVLQKEIERQLATQRLGE